MPYQVECASQCGAVAVIHPQLGDGDDKSAHVIAGDIVSPQQTDFAVDEMLRWLSTQQGLPASGR